MGRRGHKKQKAFKRAVSFTLFIFSFILKKSIIENRQLMLYVKLVLKNNKEPMDKHQQLQLTEKIHHVSVNTKIL